VDIGKGTPLLNDATLKSYANTIGRGVQEKLTTGGTIALNAGGDVITRAGSERKNAYEAVQRAAMKTWKGEGTFAENAKGEPEIAARLTPEEIDRLCSLDIHFKHVDATFKALGLE